MVDHLKEDVMRTTMRQIWSIRFTTTFLGAKSQSLVHVIGSNTWCWKTSLIPRHQCALQCLLKADSSKTLCSYSDRSSFFSLTYTRPVADPVCFYTHTCPVTDPTFFPVHTHGLLQIWSSSFSHLRVACCKSVLFTHAHAHMACCKSGLLLPY